MKKRRILFLILAVTLIIGLCACVKPKEEDSFSKLIIGGIELSPYFYTNMDGEPDGIDVEIAREACRRIGYQPEFVSIEWQSKDNLLQSGQIDCIWSCFSMDGQENEYEWIGPYLTSRQVVAVLEDSPIYELEDLAGKRIGVQTGSVAEEIFLKRELERIPKTENIYSLTEMSDVATALRNRYVDAISGYAAAISNMLGNSGIKYRLLEDDIVNTRIGVAFSKDSDPKLREDLADALSEMRKDGTIETILLEYRMDVDKALEEDTNEQQPDEE